MDITESALYISLAIILITTLSYLNKIRRLPPGPVGLPYVGYWPFLKTSTCHHQLMKMKNDYGEVSSFNVFGYLYINLASLKVSRETASKSDCFAARIRDFSLLRNTFNDGVAFINGEEWKIHRKFFALKLKEFAFNSFKESQSEPVYEAVQGSVEDLRKTQGKPFDIVEILSKRCTEVLRRVLFGENGVTDEECLEICRSYEIVLANMTGPNLLLVGNFARCFILPFTHGYSEAMKHNKLKHKNMYAIIENRKSSYEEGTVRDIIDVYIKERNERLARNDPTAKHFTDEVLMGTTLQLIGDGITTVSVFVCAFFRALLDHPEEQDRIYEELMEVVGADREPSIEDKSRLPYTNAFIMEVVRTCDVFPFFPELECTRETTINGCRIPKGSLILLNTWSSHYDPKEYEQPDEFNPDRFIAKNGRKKAEAPILFGIGKRACMGEGFAMSQAFLFLTAIVKHFRLSRASSNEDQLLFLVGKLEICAHPRESS